MTIEVINTKSLKNFIKLFKNHLINIPGKHTRKKLLAIESDDWGAIRMPSKETYELLKEEGYKPNNDPYMKYDCLASPDDFNALFDVLNSVEDQRSNPAIITANCVMGNPDFKKIKASEFKTYYWKNLKETWRDYPDHQYAEKSWKEGLNKKFLKFQCHGREHLNVFQWMKALNEGNPLVHKAFDLNMISISSVENKLRFDYMEGLDFFSEDERREKEIILNEAFEEFQKFFNYSSKTFIANCYIWDDSAEKVLKNNGVEYIQGMTNQIKPVLNSKDHHKYVIHYMTQKNKFHMRYLVRNAFFEPSLQSNVDWVSDCLRRISIAFKWGKPAIIGSHRVNFIGQIDESNRERNLKKFKTLLHEIKKNWPDVIFTSSDHIIDEMNTG